MRFRDGVAELRVVIRAEAAAHGARDIRVFGSVAPGEEDAASDVDFLIVLDPGRTLLDLTRLEARLEALLGRRVEVATEDTVRESVSREGLLPSEQVLAKHPRQPPRRPHPVGDVEPHLV